ncbi:MULTISPECIES: GGDEF domain-containing protein [unclassified Pseudofrankia]|uniref:GGDEF domain-containing protein n=1 Tax=unclassified Pseudofrankia TaxID=2994372 RepID=UPI00289DA294|nr:GGDEF domain-containing protein [Pseudofrankia sp. BMG5.37]
MSRWFWGAAAVSVLVVVAAAIVAVVPAGRAALLTLRLILIVSLLLGGLTCVVTGLRRRGAQRWWRLLVAVMVLAVAAGAVALFRDVAAGGAPAARLTAASLFFLVPCAFGLAGVLLYPSDPFDLSSHGPERGRDRRWYVITILDSVIVVGAVGLLAWVAVLEDVIERRGPLAAGTLYLIIITAVSLVLTVVVILVATFRQPRAGLGLVLLMVGLLTQAASLMWYLSAVVRGLRDLPRLVDLPLVAGPLLIGLAALSPDGPLRPPLPTGPDADRLYVAPRRRWWHALLPYLPLGAAAAVTLIEIAGEDIARQEEIWVLLALLLLAAVRQTATMADNIRLVGQLEESRHQLRHQAFHDPLTGLANRALFNDRLDQALSRRDQPTGRLAVLFCDLDHFKQVNDVFGHTAGDDLLRVTGRRLTSCVRGSDTVARLGGDEFAILLTSTAEDPETVGRRLLASVRAPIRLAGTTHAVAASTGLVVVDPAREQVTAETLLHRADLAMYAAKGRRTGELTVYTPDLAAPGPEHHGAPAPL